MNGASRYAVMCDDGIALYGVADIANYTYNTWTSKWYKGIIEVVEFSIKNPNWGNMRKAKQHTDICNFLSLEHAEEVRDMLNKKETYDEWFVFQYDRLSIEKEGLYKPETDWRVVEVE